MNIIKAFKNRLNNNFTETDSEAGFSLLEGIISITIMTTVMVVGAGMMNEDGGVMGLIDNAKQVQTASLAQTTMTNIVFYDLDTDSDTNEKSAVKDFNDVNVVKGFTAYVERNDDCVAVQVVADNGSDSIEKSGTNCEVLVQKLSKNAVKVEKEVDTNEGDSIIEDIIPHEILKIVAYNDK